MSINTDIFWKGWYLQWTKRVQAIQLTVRYYVVQQQQKQKIKRMK